VDQKIGDTTERNLYRQLAVELEKFEDIL